MRKPEFRGNLISFFTGVCTGLVVFAVLLEAGLRLGGFIMQSRQEYKNKLSLRQKDHYRIMCLGDSSTQGQYPRFLVDVLNNRNCGMKFSVIDKGQAGATPASIIGDIETDLNEYRPDMVVVMMGCYDIGAQVSYPAEASPGILQFIRSLRIYKLARLLWLHLVTDAKGRRSGLFDLGVHEIYAAPENAQPGKDMAYVERGLAHFTQGDLSQAEECYLKALELNPKNDKAYVELGWLYRKRGQTLRAEEYYKKALELNPRNDMAYLEFGRIYHERGFPLQAEKYFKKAIEFNPGNDLAFFESGLLCYEQRQFPLAENFLKKAIDLNPGNHQAYYELGRMYYEQGYYATAEEFLDKAIVLDPGNDQVYLERGRVWYVQGYAREAEECFKKAIELNPKNGKAYVECGWIYRNRGQERQAAVFFKKAVALNLSYIALGPNTEHFPQKEAVLKKAVASDPQSDSAYLDLGRSYFYNGRQELLPQAETCFKKALELNPGNYMAYFELGGVYQAQGRFQEAEERFRQALALDIGNKAQLFSALGRIYTQMGRIDSAWECYRKADDIRMNTCDASTASSYRKLKEILDKRNIKLVCVQYPMRNIGPLKKIFQGADNGIIFVDNENVFKDAVKANGYNAYFRDMHGGDFGHCTEKGNQLLAENIARVIFAAGCFK